MFDIHHPFEELNLVSGLFHPDKAGVPTVPENKPASLSWFFFSLFEML